MTTKQPISDTYDYYIPGWLVQREMAKNSLSFLRADFVPTRMLHPIKTDPPKQIPSLLSLDVPSPQHYKVPPPTFNPNIPPPSLPSMSQPPPQLLVPLYNPNVPPPSINMSMPPPPMVQIGMKRNHSFPGRQMEPMHIPPQRG